MFEKLQDFFVNKLLGKLIVRLAVAAASYAASGQLGLTVNMDPNQVALLLTTGANAALTFLKHKPVELPAPEPIKP